MDKISKLEQISIQYEGYGNGNGNYSIRGIDYYNETIDLIDEAIKHYIAYLRLVEGRPKKDG